MFIIVPFPPKAPRGSWKLPAGFFLVGDRVIETEGDLGVSANIIITINVNR
jgi:hypothetical protein